MQVVENVQQDISPGLPIGVRAAVLSHLLEQTSYTRLFTFENCCRLVLSGAVPFANGHRQSLVR